MFRPGPAGHERRHRASSIGRSALAGIAYPAYLANPSSGGMFRPGPAGHERRHRASSIGRSALAGIAYPSFPSLLQRQGYHTTNRCASGTCQAADGRMNHGKPISESRPARRTFNTPNAAGVSRDTDARPDSDQRPTGQPASSTSQRRDANGTTDCTINADYRQAASKELAAKTKAVAEGRRNPVKFAGHRSWVSDDSRNQPLATHG